MASALRVPKTGRYLTLEGSKDPQPVLPQYFIQVFDRIVDNQNHQGQVLGAAYQFIRTDYLL
jgi:hypothetical protein